MVEVVAGLGYEVSLVIKYRSQLRQLDDGERRIKQSYKEIWSRVATQTLVETIRMPLSEHTSELSRVAFTTSNLWAGLAIVGYTICLVGVFLLMESSSYTGQTVGLVTGFNNDSSMAMVQYAVVDQTTRNEYEVVLDVNSFANNSIIDRTDTDAKPEVGDQVNLWFMPTKPHSAVATTDPLVIAGYILMCFGGAMLLAFWITYLFTPTQSF